MVQNRYNCDAVYTIDSVRIPLWGQQFIAKLLGCLGFASRVRPRPVGAVARDFLGLTLGTCSRAHKNNVAFHGNLVRVYVIDITQYHTDMLYDMLYIYIIYNDIYIYI